jgi:hypothetical protein
MMGAVEIAALVVGIVVGSVLVASLEAGLVLGACSVVHFLGRR